MVAQSSLDGWRSSLRASAASSPSASCSPRGSPLGRSSVGCRPGASTVSIRFHRPKIFGPEDVQVHAGIPCTTVARTLVDCAGVLRFEPLELTVETAERLGVLDVKAITDVLARIVRPRGVRNLRRCLGPERLDASLAASRLERRFLRLCLAAGLPRPEINHRIEVAPGVWHKVAFAWPAGRQAIEVDSWEYHRTRTAARRDRRRDRELRDAGWRVDRFTDDDIDTDAGAITAFLRPLV